MAKLSETQLAAAVDSLPGWSMVDGKLHREYVFPDFVHAFGFMAAAAIAIEAMEHHPEWFNVWNRVVIDLTTHDVGGITAKDILLAGKMEELAKRLL
jgi:4a-hydroxytetrahydrobiopterin dehydratase